MTKNLYVTFIVKLGEYDYIEYNYDIGKNYQIIMYDTTNCVLKRDRNEKITKWSKFENIFNDKKVVDDRW